jgi:hypothetical protein
MAYLAMLTLDRGRRAGLLATAGVAADLSVHAVVVALVDQPGPDDLGRTAGGSTLRLQLPSMRASFCSRAN